MATPWGWGENQTKVSESLGRLTKQVQRLM